VARKTKDRNIGKERKKGRKRKTKEDRRKPLRALRVVKPLPYLFLFYR
jgi:hypothetical protein